MGAAAAAVGRPARFAAIPAWILPAAAHASGLAARISGREPTLSPDKVGEILHKDWAVRDAERPPLPLKPRFSLTEGFANAVAWYRQAGWMG
jgi:hypothetical protein